MTTPSTVKSSQKIFFSIRKNLTTDQLAVIAGDRGKQNLTADKHGYTRIRNWGKATTDD